MNKKALAGWGLAGVLVLGAGCAMLEKGTLGSAGAVGPEPGTRAYFEQKIKGKYAFDSGELKRITGPFNAPGMPLSVVPGTSANSSFQARLLSSRVQWLEGRVQQVLSNRLVVCSQPVTNASGAVTFSRSCLVALAEARPSPAEGSRLRVLAVYDGSFTYQDASGSGFISGYREVAEPTYEDYLKIYERDCQAAAVAPLVSVTRATNMPSVVRQESSMPGSYTGRLRSARQAPGPVNLGIVPPPPVRVSASYTVTNSTIAK